MARRQLKHPPQSARLTDRARIGHANCDYASHKAASNMAYTLPELRVRGFGAGDENRTRTISLGIGQIMADEDAGQPTSKTRSSRD
jgi:hypothetical protein